MPEQNTFTPLDHDIRLLATEHTQDNLSIEAGAGTGKTTLLSHRYVNTVLKHNLPLSQCVAITFTEKAALELKQRIHDLLLEKQRPDLAKDVYTAPISTIHAFCSNLLHQKPFAAGLDPNFSQLDPLQQQAFLENCFNLFLSQCLDQISDESNLNSMHASQVLNRLNAYDIQLRKIKSLCLDAYHHRLFFSHTALKAVAWPNTQNFILSLSSAYKKLWELAQAHCNDTDDLGYKAIANMLSKLNYLSDQNVIEHINSIMFQLKISSRDGSQKKWGDAKTLKYIKETFSHLKQQLENMQLQLGHCIASDTLFLLKDFVDFVAKQKQINSTLDFDDLLHLSLRLIKEDASSRQYFQSMYQCFFVDEFQDTDPIQKELVWLLSGLYQSDTQHSTFIVGDPKQSIYRFRGASLETYAHATQDFKNKQQHKPIVQNFRSSEKILHWINVSFSKLLKDNYHPLSALPTHKGKNPAIVSLEPDQDSEALKSQAALQKEAQSIAHYIHELLQKQDAFIYDKESLRYRPAVAKDIALIYPTSTNLDYLEESLRKHGIPFLSQSSRSFFKRSEIEGIIGIIYAMVMPSDSIALAAALKSCYLGIDDQDLFDLFTHMPQASLLDIEKSEVLSFSPALNNALINLKNCYQHLHQKPHYSIKQILDYIVEKFFVFPALALRKHQQQAFANLEKFILLAQYYETSVSSHLYDFTHWCLSNQDKSHDQPEAPINTQNINAVQLMTMHKSKGLEFPVVVMAQLASKSMPYPNFLSQSHSHRYAFGYSHSGQSMYTQDYAHMLKYERNSTLQEKKRLLYVACTRAKDRLVISRFASNQYKDSYHTLLEPILKETQSLLTPFTVKDADESATVRQDKTFDKDSANILSSEFNCNTVWQDYVHAQNTVLESDQTLETVFPNSNNQASQKTSLIQTLGQMEKSDFGSLFHKVMQDLAASNFNPEHLENLVLQHTLNVEHEKQLLNLIKPTLNHPLIVQAKQSKQCFAEYPLLSKSPSKAIHSMYIDLLFYDGQHWTLLDYKTDDVDQKDLEQHAQSYQKQIDLYRQALKSHGIILDHAYVFFVKHQQAILVKN